MTTPSCSYTSRNTMPTGAKVQGAIIVLRKITVEQGVCWADEKQAQERAGWGCAVCLLGPCPVRPQPPEQEPSAPRRQVGEGRKCRRPSAPGLSPSPVLVFAEGLYSGERGVVIAAFSTCTTSSLLLAALRHGTLVDVLQGVRMLHGQLRQCQAGQRALLRVQPWLEVWLVFLLPLGVLDAGLVHLLHGLEAT